MTFINYSNHANRVIYININTVNITVEMLYRKTIPTNPFYMIGFRVDLFFFRVHLFDEKKSELYFLLSCSIDKYICVFAFYAEF